MRVSFIISMKKHKGKWANQLHDCIFVGLVGSVLAKEGRLPSVYDVFSGASKVSIISPFAS